MAAERFTAGTQLGAYRIVDLLGRGGMGAVYEAEAPDGRRVALKVLPRELADPRLLQRFKREGRAAAALVHPNVVALLETGEADGFPFLVFELVRGGTLQDRLKTG